MCNILGHLEVIHIQKCETYCLKNKNQNIHISFSGLDVILQKGIVEDVPEYMRRIHSHFHGK